MRSDLRDTSKALYVAQRTFQRIKTNYMWAFLYNCLGLPIAAGVFYPAVQKTLPPAVAGLAMAMSSVCVVLSSLALKLVRAPQVSSDDLVVEGEGVDGIGGTGQAALTYVEVVGDEWHTSAVKLTDRPG